MDVGKDKIKDLFSSKLGSFEPDVPASVWGGLDQLLSAESTPATDSSSSSNSSSSAGNSSSLKTILTVVGITAAIAMGIFFFNREDPKIVLEEPSKTETIVEGDSVEVLEEDTVQVEPMVNSKVKARAIAEPALVEEENIEQKIEIQDREEEPVIEKKEEPTKVRPEDEIRIIPIREEEKGRGVSIGVVSEIGLTGYTKKDAGGDMLLSQKNRGKEFLDILDAEGNEFILKHNKPLSFGVTVEKEISPSLSIETGLVYTLLSSEVTSASQYNIRETQSFDYIGIPVALNYTFYKVGGAKFYLSLGGMMQKDVKGRYISHLDLPQPNGENTISEDIFYDEPYYIKKHLKQTNPQFSVRTKLGVAYPLYKKLYIYGAIGGVYYFDANNKYRTIYSDKKTQLDLNLGVKYEF
ncbi:hypothetical protein [Dysgonomonas sp. Marseille-P4361]|uniref:hypothetical protein n=1 Tax=Dysgonomonas sp. Marseille-P4361 TaxID=2161820 RepID=UPI000D55F4F9|nr:hypothetical protein [Dysgonomonas sp. Marseille-P4361]